MTALLDRAAWPASRLSEALDLLGRRSGLTVKKVEPSHSPVDLSDNEQLDHWIQAESERLGLEAEPVETTFAKIDEMVCCSGPALLLLPDSTEVRENSPHPLSTKLGRADKTVRFLVLWRGNRRRVSLLAPNLATMTMATEVLTSRLRTPLEATRDADVDKIVTRAGLRGRQASRVRHALLSQQLATESIGGCWVIRANCSAAFGDLVREAGLPSMLLTMLASHAAHYLLWIGSWWLLGWISLVGRFDAGLLACWALMLFTLIPFRLLTTLVGARLSIAAGVLLKRRLLFGALKLPSDEIRQMGAGQLLGRVNEAEAVEELALVGGLLGLTSVVELAIATMVLGFGAGSWFHVLLLIAWAGIALGLGTRLYRRQRRWAQARLDMTNDLTERMVGHRTRIAQERRSRWNDGEDPALENYLNLSVYLDRTAAKLRVFVPRGWLITGILALIPEFVFGDPMAPSLAVTLGGVLLAVGAFKSLTEGMHRLAGAGVAWERIRIFWNAATAVEPLGDPAIASTERPAETKTGPAESNESSPTTNGRPLLEARQIVFGYPDRTRPVLAGVDLRVTAGERLLLEGSSGGGKSTLASILAGARVPDGGLLLLDGLDRETLGANGWRRRVAMAPQFHENHILMGSFAFNVLLGRGWPPLASDLAEAESVCRSLNLGPLLDRMPAGMQQMVGETGWQLSHGEKSRIYMARALMQRSECMILDESFASLDPETMQITLHFVLEKVPTLLVIAHP